jgi:Tfp pilus tip-associated adhesin PilY1
MKKIYILVFLISFTMQAKYYEAVLTFENGTVKKGFAEMVEIQDSKVKFRLTENGNTEKVLSTDLKKIEYTDKGGNKYEVERLFIHKDKGENGVKKGTEKYWLYVVYSNGIKLVTDALQSTFRYNPNNGTTTGAAGATLLYLGKENEDGVFFVFMLSSMSSINVGMDKSVRRHCDLLFKDCPVFLTAVNNENFKKGTLINQLIELYEKNNCNKKESKPVDTVAKPKKSKKK